jgi:nitronate monooxygenase
MGTVFLSCEESSASPNHRKALLSYEAGTTALTRGFTGKLARGIKNQLLDELNSGETEILPYPLQRALVRHLSVPAEKVDRRDLLPLWAGQSARLSHCEDVNVLLSSLVTQVSEIVGSVPRWSAARSTQSQPGKP